MFETAPVNLFKKAMLAKKAEAADAAKPSTAGVRRREKYVIAADQSPTKGVDDTKNYLNIFKKGGQQPGESQAPVDVPYKNIFKVKQDPKEE